MKRLARTRAICAAWTAITAIAFAPSVRAADPEPKGEPKQEVVEEILQVLNERGLIDKEDYDRLSARYAASEKERQSWLPKLKFYGDLRLRGEGFVYDDDNSASGDAPNQYRGRYRARLGVDAEVTDFALVHFRLATSQTQLDSPPGGDSRSENINFGFQPDWGPGPIWVDRAELELKAPGSWIPVANGKASLEVGKMGNPFIWKPIRDLMLWDNDIAPEGGAVRLSGDLSKGFNVFFNGAYFIDDENAASADPHLIATQLGATFEATDTILVGGRSTWYGFRSVDENFICRGVNGNNCNGSPGSTVGGGNIPDGLTGNPNGGVINVGEFGVYTTITAFDDWPITAWGDFAKNFSAESSRLFPGGGSQALAWNAGIAVGDRTKYVELGFDYLYDEANAFPSQFVESDWIDGRTNHRAYVFWLVRRLFTNTDLQTLVSLGNAIDDSLPEFSNSVPKSDRIRFQTDVNISF